VWAQDLTCARLRKRPHVVPDQSLLMCLCAGSEHLRITAGAATTRPICVWRLAVLPNGTIVSGDSDGAVQFWDGRFGSLLHRFIQVTLGFSAQRARGSVLSLSCVLVACQCADA